MQLRSPVRLRSDGPWYNLNELIEFVFFFRLQCFKNNPRLNYVLVRAVWTASVLLAFAIASAFFVVWLFDFGSIRIDGDRVMSGAATYFGAVSLIYWNSSTVHRGQWQYCASLYNDMLKASSTEAKDALANSLCMDLVVLDMWAHRLFADLFRDELAVAARARYTVEPASLKEFMERTNKGQFSESEALDLLEEYQTRPPSATTSDSVGPGGSSVLAEINARF